MANPVWESCCACLVMTPLSTMYSFLDQHTLQLFKDCTNIPVPENNQHLSQYICTLCYKQCDMWECFKARCQESFKLRTPGPTIPDNTEQLGQPHTQSLVVKEEPIEYEILGYQIKEEAPTDDTMNESDLDAPMEDDEEGGEPSAGPSQSLKYPEPPLHPNGKDKIPIATRQKYVKSYLEFKKWCEDNGSPEMNESTLLTYIKQHSQSASKGTLYPKFAILKATLLAFEGIEIDSFLEVKKFIKDNSQGYAPHRPPQFTLDQLMKFISSTPDEPNVTMKLIVSLWISGMVQPDEVREQLLRNVHDRGDHIEVHSIKKGTMKKYVIKPFPEHNYDPLPLIRNYLDVARNSNRQYIYYIQHFKNGQVGSLRYGVNNLLRMAKKVAGILDLPNHKSYSTKSVPRPDKRHR